jgi:hypothetical protein
MEMSVTKAKQSRKQLGECGVAATAATALLLPPSPAAAPARQKAGVVIIAASSPRKSCLQKLLRFFPVKTVKWEFARTRRNWQLWLIVPQTPEVLEVLGYTDLESGSLKFFKFCAENGIAIHDLWVLSVTKAPLNHSLKLAAAIKSWLRDKFVPTLPLIVLILVVSILSSLTETRQQPIEVDSISPARWIAPAILAPSAPPALPAGAGAGSGFRFRLSL